jgi:predicted enzyme related to lactoylglutathione lyase
MKVKRIVANIEASNTDEAIEFYSSVFGLIVLMDFGWIKTFGTDQFVSLGALDAFISEIPLAS